MPEQPGGVSREAIIEFVRQCVLARVPIAPAELDNDTVLADIGLESVDVVLITGQIEDAYATEVEPSMMFEHRTIHAVADHLTRLLAGPARM